LHLAPLFNVTEFKAERYLSQIEIIEQIYIRQIMEINAIDRLLRSGLD